MVSRKDSRRTGRKPDPAREVWDEIDARPSGLQQAKQRRNPAIEALERKINALKIGVEGYAKSPQVSSVDAAVHHIREHYPSWSKAKIAREAKLPREAFQWKNADGERLRKALEDAEKDGQQVSRWPAMAKALKARGVDVTERTLQRWDKRRPMQRDTNGHPVSTLRDLLSLARANGQAPSGG